MDKLTASLGPEYVEFLVSQVPEVLNARVKGFMQYEASLLGQVQDLVSSAMPTSYVAIPDEELGLVHLEWKLKTTQKKKVKTSSSGSVRLRWSCDQA